MLKEQKMQTIEAVAPSSPSVNPVSPPRSQMPTTPPLSISTGPAECVAMPATKIDNQNKTPFIDLPSPSFSMLNTLEHCKGNPSAAAALVMMNALLASQQNQVRYHPLKRSIRGCNLFP